MKALVLAGGFPQIALTKELQRRGYYVLMADYNENPVAKAYADKYYRVSTLDIDAVRNVVKTEKADLIITVCTDQALLTSAQISEEFGLPSYIDNKTALNVTNKLHMKKVFVDNGIPTAKHLVMEEFDSSKIKDLKFPLIIKPVDCNSSKGVIKAYDTNTAKQAFENAAKLSRTNSAVIEEYKEGLELSIDVYVENGNAKVLCVSCSEKIKSDEQFIIFREKYPSEISQSAHKQIQDTAQKIADAFGLVDSPMLIQAIWDGEEISVIEFSARTGGGVKYLLIKQVCGVDIIKETVDLTLGEKPHIELKEPVNKYILNEYIYCHKGRFDRLENFDKLKDEKVISDYYTFTWQGAEFDSINSSGDRVAGFTVQDDDIEQLQRKHNAAVRELKVLDENGRDIMRHDLLPNANFRA